MRGSIILLLVLTFALTNLVYAEPNLIGWWKFDEGSGTDANDSSGNNNHGTLYGDTSWVFGKIGDYALDFDGDGDYVDLDAHIQDYQNLATGTISIWFKESIDVAESADFFCASDGEDYRSGLFFGKNMYYSNLVVLITYLLEWRSDYISSTSWHHFAYVTNPSGNWIYLDGKPMSGSYSRGSPSTNAFFVHVSDLDTLRIGHTRRDNKVMYQCNGLIDDVRIYNRALSPDEIEYLYRIDPAIAWKPYPPDGQQYTEPEPNVVLTWSPGDWASDVNGHDIYLGTGFNDVNDANTSITLDVYKGRQDANYYDPCGLEWGQIYYWRIDQVNDSNIDSPWKGRVWSFTVPDYYILIDDFEAYDNNIQIRAVWVPSGLGYVVLKYPDYKVPPHEYGIKAMELEYFGYGCALEADRTFDSAEDFTAEGKLKALTLYFLGVGKGSGKNNDPAQLYIRLQSADGNAATVFHPDNPNAILSSDLYQEWNIKLQDFKQEPAGNDVNVAEVDHIVIGIGFDDFYEPNSGRVIFDDFRLYPSRCIFDYLYGDDPNYFLYGDMAGNNGDCTVDDKDLGLMSDDWLNQNPGLILWYKMDDSNDSNVVDDSSGRGYHGTINDTNCFNQYPESHEGRMPVQGKIAGCCNFGRKDYIDVPLEVLSHVRDEITVAFWAFGDPCDPEPDCPPGDDDCRDKDEPDVVLKARYLEIYLPEPEVNNPSNVTYDYRWAAGNLKDGFDSTMVEDIGNSEYRGNWNHFAFTKDADTGIMTIYVNGDPNVRSNGEFAKIYGLKEYKEGQAGLRIGMAAEHTEDDHTYVWGSLDDFRIYDYALSDSDIARLANQQEPLSSVRGNFDNDPNGMVNFQDYAELGNNWLKEQLWP